MADNPAQLVVIQEAPALRIAGLPEADVAPVVDVPPGNRLDCPVLDAEHLSNRGVRELTPFDISFPSWKAELYDLATNWGHNLISLPLLKWAPSPRLRCVGVYMRIQPSDYAWVHV